MMSNLTSIQKTTPAIQRPMDINSPEPEETTSGGSFQKIYNDYKDTNAITKFDPLASPLSLEQFAQIQSAAFAPMITQSELEKRKQIESIQEDTQIWKSNKTESLDINKNSDMIAQARPETAQPIDQTYELVAQAIPEVTPEIPTEMATTPLTPKNINVEGLRSNKLEVTPFQLFIDKAVDALEGISKMERRVNTLMDQYMLGRATIEEVSIETTKLTIAMSFATTVISQATQIFKEIQGIQV